MDHLAPIPSSFTSTIAIRTFKLIHDGVVSTLVVEIGQPVQDVETVVGLDWRCPVRWVQGESVHEQSACGVDAVQALQLALQLVHQEIRSRAAAKNSQVLLFDEPYDSLAASFL